MMLTSIQLQGNLSDAGKVTFKFIPNPNPRVRVLSLSSTKCLSLLLSCFVQELLRYVCSCTCASVSAEFA